MSSRARGVWRTWEYIGGLILGRQVTPFEMTPFDVAGT